MSIKENVKNTDVWIRSLFILGFCIVYYFLFFIVLLIVIFQFVVKLFTSELNSHLLDCSNALARYIFQIIQYVTFNSEVRPFPFTPCPGSKAEVNSDETTRTSKKNTSRKGSTVKKKAATILTPKESSESIDKNT